MRIPSEPVVHKVKQWLIHADEDLCLAVHAMTLQTGEPPYRLIAYHAQQCAEKCLKAFLVCSRVDFPYTHNISTLLELCSEYCDWAGELQDAERLTLYSITTRYPGEDDEVTQAEATQAVDIARQVRNRVRIELKKLGIDLPE